MRKSPILIMVISALATLIAGCEIQPPRREVPTQTVAAAAVFTATPPIAASAQVTGIESISPTVTIEATTIAVQPTATPSSYSDLTASGTPVAGATPVPTTTTGEGTIYTVRPGDTLYSIAVRFNTTVDAIKAANNLISDIITVGQELKIPGTTTSPTSTPTTTPPSGEGTIYVVRWGDTLYSIAIRFGTTVDAIKAANGLTSDLLTVGQELIIPGATTTPTATPTAPTPTPIPGGSPPPPPPTGPTTHIVQPGENLFRIALRYGTTVDAIAQANHIVNPWFIYVGQKLIIPGSGSVPPGSPGTTYVVQPGDNLYRIAIRYHTTVQALVVANNLTNPNLIYVGQILNVP
jgi:LysM repeat protein